METRQDKIASSSGRCYTAGHADSASSRRPSQGYRKFASFCTTKQSITNECPVQPAGMFHVRMTILNLTATGRVLLQDATTTQQVNKFPMHYATRRSTPCLHELDLSQLNPVHNLTLSSFNILILSSHLRLRLQTGSTIWIS